MTYPPRYTRRANFLALQQAGGAFDQTFAGYLDAELNDVVSSIDQQITRWQAITTSGGQLINNAQALAMALAGSQRFTATLAQDVYLCTGITWDSSFTTSTVLVMRVPSGATTGEIFDSSAFTVAASGGYLQVTITDPSIIAAGDAILVDAFSPGAGVLSKLASTSGGQGASLVSIEDYDGIFVATTVEGALAEFRTAYDAFVASFQVAKLFYKDGSIKATGDFDMDSHKLTKLAIGTASTDAATIGQVNALLSGVQALQNYFLRKDVAITWTASQDAGGLKLQNLAMTDSNGTSSEAACKNYVDYKVTTAETNLQAQITALGDPSASGKRMIKLMSNGTGSYTVQTSDGISAVLVELWGGGASAKNASACTSGAYVCVSLSVLPGDVISYTIGAGGAPNASTGNDGNDSILYINGSEVARAGGGKADNGTAGLNVGTISASPKVLNGYTISGGIGLYIVGSWYQAGSAPRGGGGGIYVTGLEAGHVPGGGGVYSGSGASGGIVIIY